MDTQGEREAPNPTSFGVNEALVVGGLTILAAASAVIVRETLFDDEPSDEHVAAAILELSPEELTELLDGVIALREEGESSVTIPILTTTSSPETTSPPYVPQTIIPVPSPSRWYGKLSAEGEQRIDEVPVTVLSEEDLGWGESRAMQDLNPDSKFRAATVQVYRGNSTGMAGIVEHEGQLYLRTVRHVLQKSEEQRSEGPLPLRAHIPGIGIVELPELENAIHEDSNELELDQDTNTLIPLRPALESELRRLESEGGISFLRIADQTPVPGKVYLIPNAETGSYIRVRLENEADPLDETDNIHIVVLDGDLDGLDQQDLQNSLGCLGFSGIQLVDPADRTLSYGGMVSVHGDRFEEPGGRICYTSFGFQSN